MNGLTLYHTSGDAPIKVQTHFLGRVLEACIKCRAFIVGYNVLETVNDYDLVLLSLLMKDQKGNKEAFELLTGIKLIEVGGQPNESDESGRELAGTEHR